MFQIICILIILVMLFTKFKIEVVVGNEIYLNISILKYIKIINFRFNEKEVEEIGSKSKKLAKEEVYNNLKQIEFTDAKLLIKNFKELLSKVEYEKIDFNLNINVKDYILNAYITSAINSIVAMLISKNINKINTDNLNYSITSDENKIKFNLKCIMYGKVTNIIFVMIKVAYYVFKLKKRGNEKNGRKRTPNRKFNGNSDVVARSNG